MANNNVQNVKFLRNGSLFETRELAKSTLKGFTVDNEKDGTAILARYSGGTIGGEDFFIKTLVGFVYANGDNKSVTVFDIDDVGADVQEAIDEINTKIGTGVTTANTVTAQLAALSGKSTDTSETTSVVGAKKYTDAEIDKLSYTGVTTGNGVYVTNVTQSDGKVSATTATLPSVNAISEAGKPITAVSESLGSISATAGTINAEFVNIADSGSIITATNVEGALAEIAAEIDAMDLAVVSGDGEVITAVSEKDGKVSASKTAIKDVKLTGYVKSTSTGPISATDDIEDALSKLENTIGSNAITNADGSITVTPANGSTTDVKLHIKDGERVIKLDGEGGGIYTNLNLVKITTGLSATIKESYEFRDSDGNKIGASIDIEKDSHIVSITYDETTQKLIYKYLDASGVEQTTSVDMAHLILETEVENGIQSVNGKLSIKLDTTGDDTGDGKFLTVGADGLKLDGVTDAINTAISGLDATVGSTTIATDKHVAVEVVETDGKLTALNINENNIADADDLAQEIAGRESADTALSNRLGNGVTADNTATAQLAALSGNSATAQSGDTSVEGAKKYADAKLAEAVAGLDATVSGETADGKVNVKVTEADGVITAVNVVGTDIASASALTAETAARKAVDGQTGQTYAKNTNANYINNATSLNDADVKLDAALKALDGDVIKSVKVNGKTLNETSNSVNVQISSVPASGTEASPIVVNTNESTGAVTLQILQIDCGEY